MRQKRTARADGTVLVSTDPWGQGEISIRQVGDTMFSYWRPSFVERLRILFGGHVRLGVFGNAHPPVSIDTCN